MIKSMSVHMTTKTFSLDDAGNFIEEEQLELHTNQARFLLNEDSFVLSFSNKDGESLCDMRLLYHIANQNLTLSCKGSACYTAVFQENQTCDFIYAVPPFSFEANAKTESLSLAFNENGGTLHLSYLLSLNGLCRKIRVDLCMADKQCAKGENLHDDR